MPIITSKLVVGASTMEPQLPPSRKVHVVYYLSRAGQLEHPHLLEVSISPTEGLYLRDVKKRLAVIRGRSLPSTFAWSYKRSYKNGYVWQDLCDDDLIFPAHGCDYVLKGSEIVTEAYADKCRHGSGFGSEDGKHQQELPKNRCQKSSVSTKATLPPAQYAVLEQSTDGADKDYVARGTSVSNSRSHMTFDFAHAQEENPQYSHAQSARMQHNNPPSPGRFYAGTSETSGEEEVRSNWKHIPTKASLQHVSMVENGTDATTQTEEEAKALCAAALTNNVERLQQNPTELKKGDISSPPSSSSTTSVSRHASASTTENPASSDENRRTPGPWKRSAQHPQELQDETVPGTPSTQAATRKLAVASQDCRSEEPSPRPRAKLSGASSLLQFVSCGGLDIKEQILPMSLYLKSKGSQHPSTEHLCDVLYAGQGRSWNRLGRRNCLKPKSSYEIETASSPGSEKSFSEAPTNIRRDNKDNFSAPPSLSSEAVLQDVISIGRPSISDRSTNVSRELDYQTDAANSKLKSSGYAEIKGSPRFTPELDYQTDSPKSRGSRELKSSPLFVPGKCVNRRSGPLYSNGGGLATPFKDAQKPASNASPRALSDRDEIRETVTAAKRNLAMGEKGGYESMAQLWEELRSPKSELKDGDQRLQTLDSNALDWERTLQNAVDMSLPPVEFLVLHECLHCDRKFKPELLKAHIKSCSAQKSSKSAALGRPPKPDANIYQRLLRASPPPTK